MVKHRKVSLVIASALFGLSCLAGYCIAHTGEPTISTMLMVSVVDTFLFYIFVLLTQFFFDTKQKELFENNYICRRIYSFFNRRTGIKVFFALLITGLFFATVKYPGVVSGGTQFMIQQAMGMDTRARSLSPVIYEGHYITGHHPILLTCFIGAFIKLGLQLGHPNWGMYWAACSITFLNALGWSYVLVYFRKYMKPFAWTIIFLWFILNPMLGNFNSCVLKDNLFATILAVFSCIIHEYCNQGTRRSFAKMLACSISVPFIKNQGIYIVIIAMVGLIAVHRKKVFEKTLCIVLPIQIFQILFEGFLMPALKIAPGGKQEMLSILFQPTARTILEHPEIKETDEYEVIQKVLPIDDWSVYNERVSDAIKFRYNQKATKEELVNYFKVWIKMGGRYPKSYLFAILHQTYGYYCIDCKTSDWVWKGYELQISDAGDVISAPEFKLHFAIVNYLAMFVKSERIYALYCIPISFWAIVIGFLLFKGKISELIWMAPVILQWMICLVSPVNGGGRYGMVIYMMAPILLGFVNNNNSELRSRLVSIVD